LFTQLLQWRHKSAICLLIENTATQNKEVETIENAPTHKAYVPSIFHLLYSCLYKMGKMSTGLEIPGSEEWLDPFELFHSTDPESE
jgi:hypothetical protein